MIAKVWKILRKASTVKIILVKLQAYSVDRLQLYCKQTLPRILFGICSEN